MATVREGSRTVLLVVDVQVGVMEGAWDAPRVVAKVARAVERARAAGVPVVWVQHEGERLVRDSPPWRWVPELVPGEGEVLIHKRFHSAFERTALEQELARLGASHLVLAGAASNWCIRAAAYAALERGYDLTLVADAHTTGPTVRADGRVIAAEDVVEELNAVLCWLSYPGRRIAVVAAEEVDFGAPNGTRA